MKTLTVKGQNIIVIRERGLGDGGIVLRYFVEEEDGTYSQAGEWYSDPKVAARIYDAPQDDAHLTWIMDEARRQTLAKDERPAPEPVVKPAELVAIEAEIKAAADAAAADETASADPVVKG